MRIRPLVSVLVSLSCAGVLAAQNTPPLSPAAPTQQWRSFLGANPIGIAYDIVSVEAETAIGAGGTIGLVGSYNDVDNTKFRTIDAKFKYYPGEIALQGFLTGLSLGYTKFDRLLSTAVPPAPDTRGKVNSTTLGVVADYNFALGPSQRFVVGTGLGAKRILATESKRAAADLPRAYVTARFVVGLLF